MVVYLSNDQMIYVHIFDTQLCIRPYDKTVNVYMAINFVFFTEGYSMLEPEFEVREM